jgi:hypothetical protein
VALSWYKEGKEKNFYMPKIFRCDRYLTEYEKMYFMVMPCDIFNVISFETVDSRVQ